MLLSLSLPDCPFPYLIVPIKFNLKKNVTTYLISEFNFFYLIVPGANVDSVVVPLLLAHHQDKVVLLELSVPDLLVHGVTGVAVYVNLITKIN